MKRKAGIIIVFGIGILFLAIESWGRIAGNAPTNKPSSAVTELMLAACFRVDS